MENPAGLVFPPVDTLPGPFLNLRAGRRRRPGGPGRECAPRLGWGSAGSASPRLRRTRRVRSSLRPGAGRPGRAARRPRCCPQSRARRFRRPHSFPRRRAGRPGRKRPSGAGRDRSRFAVRQRRLRRLAGARRGRRAGRETAPRLRRGARSGGAGFPRKTRQRRPGPSQARRQCESGIFPRVPAGGQSVRRRCPCLVKVLLFSKILPLPSPAIHAPQRRRFPVRLRSACRRQGA